MKTEPKYIKIKNDIKQAIEKNVFKLGSKIPSETDLLEKYGVSRHTIRQSISELVNEGYLYKHQGAGTFVDSEYKNKIRITEGKRIGVITTYLSNYIFPSIIRGIEDELAMRGFTLLLASTQNDFENERMHLDKMLNQDVDGLIIEPTKSNLLNPNLNYYLDLMKQKKPLIMLNASYDELDIPVVAIDDVKATIIATEHLIDLGHTKIGMITKMDDKQGKNRLKGFLKALTHAELSFNSNHIINFDTESKSIISQKIASVLSMQDLPTAFVVYNDEISVSLLKEIHKIGKKCPDDFSIVSHDNSFYSTSFPTIKLTSVNHPKEELGRVAAKWIMDSVDGKNDNSNSVIFNPELVIGTSTKKL